jgi:hypothetical protein
MANRDSVLGIGNVTPDRSRDEGEPRDVTGTDATGTSGHTIADDPERAPATGSLRPSKGATGIDMGAGGNGTDIER